ncbi:protoporphyrinogen/coproporphyrinogen oxidase [Candidatus Poriferisocius sp.]|uniref:protoporphyrinogen/coproporphyrinogen oxidase n=1 Tax=Candidatus Poriferisocius sp. TaxID=3101276 RepID=UPI003B01DE11
MPRAIVVGAGAAGISAAFRLHQAGWSVRVLEASERVGGRCRTIEADGYRFDVGAGALPDTYDAVERLLADASVGAQVDRLPPVIGTLHDGAVHRIDRARPWTFLSAGHLSAGAKLRITTLLGPFLRIYRSVNDSDLASAAPFDVESVDHWCRRRGVDEQVVTMFIRPLCRALFLVEPAETSIVDLFGAMKSVLLAGRLLTHSDGVGFFLDRIAQRLDVEVCAEVNRVSPAGGGAKVEWTSGSLPRSETVDGVVVATPASRVPDLVECLTPAARQYLYALSHSRTIVVSLGLATAPDETSSMVLIPREIDPSLPVVGLTHNMADGRTPPGGGILTAFFMTDWSNEHWADEDNRLVDGFVDTLRLRFPAWPLDSLQTAVVTRWDPALVASRVGTYRDLVHLREATGERSSIQLAGDYFARSSVNAAVTSGELAAGRLAR